MVNPSSLLPPIDVISWQLFVLCDSNSRQRFVGILFVIYIAFAFSRAHYILPYYRFLGKCQSIKVRFWPKRGPQRLSYRKQLSCQISQSSQKLSTLRPLVSFPLSKVNIVITIWELLQLILKLRNFSVSRWIRCSSVNTHTSLQHLDSCNHR